MARSSSPTDLNSETEQIRPVSHGHQGWRSFLLIRKWLSKELRIVLDRTRRIKKKTQSPFLLLRAVKILNATFFENNLFPLRTKPLFILFVFCVVFYLHTDHASVTQLHRFPSPYPVPPSLRQSRLRMRLPSQWWFIHRPAWEWLLAHREVNPHRMAASELHLQGEDEPIWEIHDDEQCRSESSQQQKHLVGYWQTRWWCRPEIFGLRGYPRVGFCSVRRNQFGSSRHEIRQFSCWDEGDRRQWHMCCILLGTLGKPSQPRHALMRLHKLIWAFHVHSTGTTARKLTWNLFPECSIQLCTQSTWSCTHRNLMPSATMLL